MEQTETNKTKKQSPNLLSSDLFKQNPVIEKNHINISLIAKILIITTQITYVLLLGYNFTLLRNIESTEGTIQNHKTEIQNNNSISLEIEDVIKKTKRLKTLEQERVEINTKFKDIYRLFPTGTTLVNSTLEKDFVDMTVQTNDVLGVSILMSNYFDENITERIVLKSAQLNTNDNTFTTKMEVHFK